MSEALWAMGRATGILSLVLFTAVVVLGIVGRSGRPLPGLPRFAVAGVHRNLALVASVFLVIHVVSLFFDPYAQLTLVDAVAPFLGSYRPLFLGLGTVALDLVVAIVVTGLARRFVGQRMFRFVHWFTYAMWPIAVVHAVGIGTDSGGWPMWVLTGVLVASVAGAVAWRLSPRYVENRPFRVKEVAR